MTGAQVEHRPPVTGGHDRHPGGRTAPEPAAEQAALPAADNPPADRGFLHRAVRRMATQWHIRQFLDIGGLLPGHRNTHQVVADAGSTGRVVYAERDQRVVDRGRRLLAGLSGTALVEADVREPERIFAHPETRRLIDFSKPVGLLLVTVMQFVPDADDPWGVVRRYVDAVAPGSWLALSGLTCHHRDEALAAAGLLVCDQAPPGAAFRSRAEIQRFFDGLEIVPPYAGADPAVTYAGRWGAEDATVAEREGPRWCYAAVARKPRVDGGR
jgi:hypothetical protein